MTATRSPAEVAAEIAEILPRPRSFQAGLYLFNLANSTGSLTRTCAEVVLGLPDVVSWGGPDAERIRAELTAMTARPL